MNDINIIKDSLKKNRFELEINDIQLYSNSTDEIKSRLNYLLSELNKIKHKNSNSSMIKSTSTDELNDLFNKMDKNIQSQKWSKLPQFIQNQKIQEFIYEKESNKEKAKELYKVLHNDIISKKIKSKDIIYNSAQCKIIEIHNYKL